MSDKAKHTQGPWEWSGDILYGGRKFYEEVLCPIDEYGNPGIEVSIPDMALIAAAPKLLEALCALGAMPIGYCFCTSDRYPHKKTHTGECSDARKIIAQIMGG